MILHASVLFAFAAGDLLLADPGELQNQEPQASCNYAIALDVNRGCGTECANQCGIMSGSTSSWAFPIGLSSCAERLRTCALPVGSVARLTPDGPSRTDVSVEPRPSSESLSGFILMNKLNSATTQESNYIVRRILAFTPRTLRLLGDPWRLSWASVQKSSRVNAREERDCMYANLMLQTDLIGDYDWPTIPNSEWVHYTADSGTGVNLGQPRSRPLDEIATGDHPQGAFVYTPSVVALVQQWFMRYGRDEGGPGLSLSFVTTHSLDSNGSISMLPDFEKEDKTAYQLEAMTTFNWKTNVPPECAKRTNCKSCNVYSICSWCDMSNTIKHASFHSWAGWHSSARSVQDDGSACGVSPLVCAMMGGEPFTDQCRADEL